MFKIRQMLDTPIEVRASKAFARVYLHFIDVKGETVEVELDIESWLKVVPHLDEGPAIQEKMLLTEQEKPEEKHGWWISPLAILGLLIIGGLFTWTLISSYPNHLQKCEAMSGHYIYSQLYYSEECWSQDGTKRLFPWKD